MPSKKSSSEKKSAESFERSLKRLEEIVEQLEDGNITLDEVMKIYEEGVSLSKQCLEQLSHAEIKLKRLSKDARGNFDLSDGIGGAENE